MLTKENNFGSLLSAKGKLTVVIFIISVHTIQTQRDKIIIRAKTLISQSMMIEEIHHYGHSRTYDELSKTTCTQLKGAK